jgi:hypothetical protein
MPRYLTKSRFKLACECPTKLFYTGKSSYYDASKDDDFLAMLADGGYQVGALAKLGFPNGIEIHGLEHQKSLDETNTLLKANEQVVLFEPAIRFGNCFIRIDVLVKDGQNFELIEVKAKSFHSEKPELVGKNGKPKSDMLPYVLDAAFQTWVLRSAIPGARIKTFLMMPDKSRVAEIDGINQMFKIDSDHRDVEVRLPNGVDGKQIADALLAKVDVTFLVEDLINGEIAFPGGQEKLDTLAANWAAAYAADTKIAPTIGSQCGNCQFKNDPNEHLKNGRAECWSAVTGLPENDLVSGTVLDIWNFRGKQKLIDQGIYKISQVQRDDLGDFDEEINHDGLSTKQRQWFQIGGLPYEYKYRGYYLNESLILSVSQGWKFPYHFIDFETASVALPFNIGMRPYEQTAFQFSHHVMEADGSVRHAGQFLSTMPGRFPNFAFARALRNELAGDKGTVFMWSPHENTILTRILAQLAESDERDRDELGEFVASLLKGQSRAMYDLCALASKAYFHPMTKGSNSIKKVLPSILSASEELRDKYAQPIYGAPGGIPSLNFSCEEGFAWLDPDLPGGLDPYQKLKALAKDMLPPGVEEDGSVIAEGGAAATAYSRLQFEDLDKGARKRIEEALLKYCETDTMAMVWVVQGWLGQVHG